MFIKPLEVYATDMKGLSAEEQELIVPPNTILLGYVGSISHGTYRPSSDPNSVDDKDILGVCVGAPEVYLGLKHFEQKELKYKEWDSVVYELRKMFRLWLQCNPNTIALLWLEPHYYIIQTDAGKSILAHRDIFSSKEAYHRFTGYAYSQLHRMEHLAFKGYMGEKRKQLVEKHGYDTKNASHLIRLLRMGIEFLSEGKLHVYREDAPELVEIKNGAWTLQRVKDEATRLFALSKEAYVRSVLPDQPDFERAEKLLMSILAKHLTGELVDIQCS